MELIFSAQYFKEVMADMNYDVEKLPLGKLSRTTIEKGYGHLKVCRRRGTIGDKVLTSTTGFGSNCA
jgi:hypothetical protein